MSGVEEHERAQAEVDDARVEAAVLAAMQKAARAGLGNRGRIRAGQRAMSKEQGRIAKERGR